MIHSFKKERKKEKKNDTTFAFPSCLKMNLASCICKRFGNFLKRNKNLFVNCEFT